MLGFYPLSGRCRQLADCVIWTRYSNSALIQTQSYSVCQGMWFMVGKVAVCWYALCTLLYSFECLCTLWKGENKQSNQIWLIIIFDLIQSTGSSSGDLKPSIRIPKSIKCIPANSNFANHVLYKMVYCASYRDPINIYHGLFSIIAETLEIKTF